MKEANISQGSLDEVILVGGSTRIPAVQELVRRLTGKEPRKDLNPDEVVALGASIQAAVLAGGTQDIVLMDVTPLSLGVETLGDVMDVVIPRNTNIPTREQRVYSTASDFQTTVEVHVLQGERARASQNKSLGRFHLAGIPPAPRGVPQIEVTFDIDANGILNVTAKDRATGKEQEITITGSGQLSSDEVSRMVQDAKAYEEEDRKFKELAEARNQGDSLAYQLEKTLNDLGDKVSESDAAPLREKIEELRKLTQGEDAQAIRNAMNDLQSAFAAISQRMYEQAAASPQTGAGPEAGPQPGPQAGSGAGPEVIDAEFEADDK